MDLGHVLPAAVLAWCLVFAGCGGGGSGAAPATGAGNPQAPQTPPMEPDPDPVPDPDPDPDPDPLEPKLPGLLTLATDNEVLVDAIRQGMRSNRFLEPPGLVDFSPSPPSATPGLPAEFTEFSITNVQEAGVDEADGVKYDGEILYLVGREPLEDDPAGDLQASSFIPPFVPTTRPVITLHRTDAGAATTLQVGRIELDPDSSRYELYVRRSGEARQLVGLTENYDYPLGGFADYTYWQSRFTRVVGWSVDDPETPREQFVVDIEGALLTSRRIDNLLYVITRFSPTVEGLITYPWTEQERAANDAVLDALDAADLLPRYAIDRGDSQPLVSARDCYVSNPEYEGRESIATGNSFITITAIDLDEPGTPQSTCLGIYASDFYLSRSSLYLTTSLGSETTLVHKVALNNGDPLYRGSGAIPGYIGTSRPSFLMSEQGADLRVISTIRQGGNFFLPVMPGSEDAPPPLDEEEVYYGDHQLTILREDATVDRLDRVARLPNDDNPEPIGKPGEQVFGARFLGDRAYVVTFRTIDPLYVLDLEDPLDPKVAGELEIPGFSTLLQPLGNGLLLGVGSEVALERALVQGVKVALFDVADPAQPEELSSVVIGRRGSSSPTLYDHRSLTLLPVEGGYRLALPIQNHSVDQGGFGPGARFGWSDSSLYRFYVDAGSRTLEPAGKLVAAQINGELADYPVNLRDARAFLNSDAVFFSVPELEEIISGLWGQ